MRIGESIETQEKMSLKMTVQEIIERYPAARKVFLEHGMGGCGGPSGPPEPLGLFALAHHCNPDVIIKEIETAIVEENASNSKSEAEPRPSESVDQPESELFQRFIRGAILISLLWGALWGVVNLTRIAWNESFTALSMVSAQGHAHIQIFGWVGLFIMGVAYHVIPRFTNAPLAFPRLAASTFSLMISGVVLHAISLIWMNVFKIMPFLLVASGMLEMLAIVFFAISMVQTIRKSPSISELFSHFLMAGLGWMCIVGIMNVIGTFLMFSWSTDIFPFQMIAAFRHAQFFGFITFFIFGVSLRAFPFLMGIRHSRQKMAQMAFYIFLVGVFCQVIALSVSWFTLSVVAAVVELVGGILFVYALRIFEPLLVELDPKHVDPIILWMIRSAYGWFIVGLIMWLFKQGQERYPFLGHAFWDAQAHAMALGFITMMILGVGFRVIPVFSGTASLSGRVVRFSFFLLMAAVLIRVALQPFIPIVTSFKSLTFMLIGLSGYLAFAGMLIFGISIWRAMTLQEEIFLADPQGQLQKITPKTSIYQLVNHYPNAREVLIELGFKRLQTMTNPKKIPRFVTLEMACRVYNFNSEDISTKLNHRIVPEKA